MASRRLQLRLKRSAGDASEQAIRRKDRPASTWNQLLTTGSGWSGWVETVSIPVFERIQRRNRGSSNLRSEFPPSLPVFGCFSRGTAKRFREVALVSETCLDRDSRNRFLAK
jgi:hypothetical protein